MTEDTGEIREESRHASRKKIEAIILRDLEGKDYHDVFQGYAWMHTFENLKEKLEGIGEEDLWKMMWEAIHDLNKEGKLRLDSHFYHPK